MVIQFDGNDDDNDDGNDDNQQLMSECYYISNTAKYFVFASYSIIRKTYEEGNCYYHHLRGANNGS